MKGRLPMDGYIVDHKDTIPINDHWTNLQEITQSLNIIKANIPKDKLYDLPKGISYNAKKDLYNVDINRKGKRIFRKYFKIREEAVRVAKEQITKYNSENFRDYCCDVPSTIPSNTSDTNTKMELIYSGDSIPDFFNFLSKAMQENSGIFNFLKL